MKLLCTVAIFGAGYVLGTRAGRERFEQIKENAAKLWDSSPIQAGREKAKSAAACTFEQAKATAVDTAKNAAEAVKNKMNAQESELDDDVIVVQPVNE